MKKKWIIGIAFVIGILGFLIIIANTSNSETSAKSNDNNQNSSARAYRVHITKVSVESDSDDWVVKGTTTAPNNSYLIGVSEDGIDETIPVFSTSDLDPVRVHQGHFSGEVSGIDALRNEAAGDKATVDFVAITPQALKKKTKKNLDVELPQKLTDFVKNHGTRRVFTLSESQSKYIKSLDDKSSGSSSSSSDSTNQSETTKTSSSKNYHEVNITTFSRYGKEYVGQNITVQGTILKTQNYHGGMLIELTDSNYNHEIIVGISKSQLNKMSYSPQEDDVINASGKASDDYETTNAISDTKSTTFGIDASNVSLVK